MTAFSTTARAWAYEPAGERYVLSLVERTLPPLAPGNVRIRVRAVSLNFRDLIALENRAGRNVAGRIACSDGAGEVVAVGRAVSGWSIGTPVCGCFFPTWTEGRFEQKYHREDLGGTLDGMLSEYVDLPATGIVRVPEFLPFTEAATLPCAAVTAYAGLFERGGLQPGATVLCLGTGGVSVFAAQLATARGATVYATSSDDAKLAQLKAMGVVGGINYRQVPDWGKAVRELAGRGMDYVVEVGGPGTLGQSLEALAPGGHVSLIGVLTGFGDPTTSLFPLMAKNARLDGIYVGSRQTFLDLNSFLAEHEIHPVIDRLFTFREAPAAFEHLGTGRHFGKIVIEVAAE